MATPSKNDHGQYFTPRHIADLMVGLLETKQDGWVLEPCAGAGVFLDALSDEGYRRLTGVEIDSRLVAEIRHEVENCSFVTWRPRRKYDAVIGNPPYIRWRNLSETSRIELQGHPLWGSLFNSLTDYLTVFISASIEALNDGGELVFITPSFWMHTQHSTQLREWMLERGSVTHLVSFGEAEVFPGVSSSIVIFRFVRGQTLSSNIDFFSYIGPRKVRNAILRLDDHRSFAHKSIPNFQPKRHWTTASADVQADLGALESACLRRDSEQLFEGETIHRLGDFVDIANGMVSGLDKAFRLPEGAYSRLNDDERQALLSVVKAFQISPLVTNQFCWYIDIPPGLSEAQVRSMFPSLLDLLDPHRAKLESRYSYARSLPYWEWAFRRSENYFLNGEPKAVVPCKERLTNKDRVRISLSPKGSVATQDVTAFSPRRGVRESLEYIVAYLNNPQITKWVRHRGLMKGGVAEFSEHPLASIPFRPINWQDAGEVRIHSEITNLLRNARKSPNSDVQQQLDDLSGALLFS